MGSSKLSWWPGVLAIVLSGALGATGSMPVSAATPLALQPSPQADAAQAALKQGRAALAAGRNSDAIALADGVITGSPSHRDAHGLKIEALAASGEVDAALRAYAAWVEIAKKEDAPLLPPIARASLRDLASRASPSQVPALEALARAGEPDARQALEARAKTSGPPDTTVLEALARLGDTTATSALGALLSSKNTRQVALALSALSSVEKPPAGLAAHVKRALAEPDVTTRLAALGAASAHDLRSLAPDVRRLLPERTYIVRLWAARTLFEWGDNGGLEILTGALRSPFPDARLTAAQALSRGTSRDWVEAVVPLLENRDGLFRLGAADLLMGIRRESAMEVLRQALGDPNPGVRAEAARVLARFPNPDVSTFRRLLADPADAVKIHAAGVLLKRP